MSYDRKLYSFHVNPEQFTFYQLRFSSFLLCECRELLGDLNSSQSFRVLFRLEAR